MGWQQDYRLIYGKSVRIHPGTPRVFEQESTRWLQIRDGLRSILKCVPRNERRLYVTLAEAMAFADYRYDGERGASVDEGPKLF